MRSFFFKCRILLYIFAFIYVSAGQRLYASSAKLELSRWMSRLYSTNNGLPQNSVQAIAQTGNGYLWFGSYGGLTRFDGVTFITFNKLTTPEITHNTVRVLLVDPRDRLWIGTANGLLRYENNQFTRFTTADGLSSDNIFSLYIDSSGQLWIGASNGLNRFDNQRFVSYVLASEKSNYHVTAVLENKNGSFWIGTEGGGLYLFNQGRFQSFNDKTVFPASEVWALNREKNGGMWVGTNKGLFLYKDGTFSNYGQDSILNGSTIHCIQPGKNGIFWIATMNGGLIKLENGNIYTLDTLEDLSRCNLDEVFQDREGSLWLGTLQCGVYQLVKPKFTFYGKNSGFPSGAVRPVIVDKKGTVWAGTIGNGVVRIKDDTLKVYNSFPGLADDFVTSLAADSDGSIWIGTYHNGLLHLKDDRLISFTSKNGLSGNTIRAVLVDSRGKIWVGTNSWGVDVIYNGSVISHYSTQNGLSDNFIFAIAEDRSHNIWVGTYTGGVNRISDNTITVYNYQRTPQLPKAIIWAIYPDLEGNIWFGTDGGGLLRFNTANDKWNVFTMRDGLASDAAMVILEDHRGNLWMNDNPGVYCVKKQDLIARADDLIPTVTSTLYGRDRGIYNTSSSGPAQPAGYMDNDGKMWFQSPTGVVVIDPENIPNNTVKPPVIIEKVLTDLKEYPGHSDIILSTGESSVNFQYTASSFTDPHLVRFKFMLVPFDKHWKDVGTRRTAYYTNLPPGKFTFKVIACNNDGLWNEQGAAVNIIIPTPFYMTYWFYFLVFLLFTGLVYLFLRIRTKTIENQKKKLKLEVDAQTCKLKQAREKAESATRSKSIFLARMSHEIRTPMNAVIGFTEMLSDTELTDEQKDFVDTINRSGKSLLNLINDILDFSKIEAGQLSLESVEFNPGETIYDACESILPRLADKPVELICHIHDDVPCLVKGDPGRFRQVVGNLISNASKFTETGEIEVSLSLEKKDGNRLKLNTSVRDTGIGIPPEKLDSIFEEFTQADNSITRKFGGTGLGLSICNQIAHLMQGKVNAQSSPGEGSVFQFTGWFESSVKEPPGTVASDLLEGKRILLVDDNVKNLEILSHHLQRAGADTRSISLSGQVLETLRSECQKGKVFDLCIIDADMPEPDGFELARQIRGLDNDAANILLIACSSLGSWQFGSFEEYGFNAYLSKPIRRKKLYSLVTKLIIPDTLPTNAKNFEKVPGKIRAGHPSAPPKENSASISILLAEDNPMNRKLVAYMLEKAGYSVVMVENGKEAVSVYCTSPGSFDLILMDVQMPVMDGKEATRQIRAAGYDSIPIIALTAETMKGDREKCLSAGMNDYISKPIKQEKIYNMVKKYINHSAI